MGFGEAIAVCFRKYFTFSGRARRSEYWWFFLFTFLVSIVLTILDEVIGMSVQGWSDAGVLGSLFSLAVFFPGIAVASRRLHDINKSGWWQLLPYGGALILIPGAAGLAAGSDGAGVILLAFGALIMLGLTVLLIVWLATDGHKGQNRFGPSPKYGGQENVFD